MNENGNLEFIFSVSPVITNLNSTVDTNKREAVLYCYAHHITRDCNASFNGSISNLCSYSLWPELNWNWMMNNLSANGFTSLYKYRLAKHILSGATVHM